MAYRMLGQDCTIKLYDGGVFDGAPNFSLISTHGVSYTTNAMSVEIDETYANVDLSGTDTSVKLRPTKYSFNLKVEFLIESSGWPALSRLGYGEIDVQLIPGGSFSVYQGVWNTVSFSAPTDQGQKMTIVLVGPYDDV